MSQLLIIKSTTLFDPDNINVLHKTRYNYSITGCELENLETQLYYDDF